MTVNIMNGNRIYGPEGGVDHQFLPVTFHNFPTLELLRLWGRMIKGEPEPVTAEEVRALKELLKEYRLTPDMQMVGDFGKPPETEPPSPTQPAKSGSLYLISSRRTKPKSIRKGMMLTVQRIAFYLSKNRSPNPPLEEHDVHAFDMETYRLGKVIGERIKEYREIINPTSVQDPERICVYLTLRDLDDMIRSLDETLVVPFMDLVLSAGFTTFHSDSLNDPEP